MYEKLAETYVRDESMREFFARSNPWALHGITERLLEAADRKLWGAPEPETLAALRRAYLDTEGDLEDRLARSAGRAISDKSLSMAPWWGGNRCAR
jgi:cobaltochelatase CobN